MGFDALSFALGRNFAKDGGSVEGVHYVTFMSEDGKTELYKRPVADGDDCADPVDRELVPEPTKESTVQYNYTHVGWSVSTNGALDENILKAVKADKTVYANFAAVVRYYTVTYYDSDGTTVLKTESLAYGAMPSYKPTKNGYDFVAWAPNAAVTGNMSYTASWKVKASFETATWAEIAAICEAGNAASNFKVGDYKPVTLTYSDGTSETINFRIVGMGADTLEDGSAASITLMADNLVKNSTMLCSGTAGSSESIYKCDTFAAFMTNLENAFPDDLMSVVKSVKKYDMYGVVKSYCRIFIPTYRNLKNESGTGTGNNSASLQESCYFPQSQYSWFAKGNSIARKKLESTANDLYWSATPFSYGTSSGRSYYRYRIIDTSTSTPQSEVGSSTAYGVCPCFCI